MVFKVIACKVLTREISSLIPQNPHCIDVTYLRQGLHSTPQKLQQALQAEIDSIDAGHDMHSLDWYREGKPLDAILLGYGLCGNGIQGLHSKKYPIVAPRAHDCITMLLGSKEKYSTYFRQLQGRAFWYSPGWIENMTMPSKQRCDLLRQKYTERYGEKKAQNLLDVESSWNDEYAYAAYIQWPGIAQDNFLAFTQEAAQYFGWDFQCFQGEDTLLRDMLYGHWDEERFLVVPPGEQIVSSFNDTILASEKISG